MACMSRRLPVAARGFGLGLRVFATLQLACRRESCKPPVHQTRDQLQKLVKRLKGELEKYQNAMAQKENGRACLRRF